jgi:hypothetical protein
MGRLGALLVLGALFPACGVRGPCPAGCVLTSASAVISVPCPDGVVAATATGPCTAPSANNSYSSIDPSPQKFYVHATGKGTCHVQITFADGYVYAADIQFVEHPNNNGPGCPYCPPITDPVSEPPPVIDPGAICASDAGADGATDATTPRAQACVLGPPFDGAWYLNVYWCGNGCALCSAASSFTALATPCTFPSVVYNAVDDGDAGSVDAGACDLSALAAFPRFTVTEEVVATGLEWLGAGAGCRMPSFTCAAPINDTGDCSACSP